jgi:hypothetical protein
MDAAIFHNTPFSVPGVVLSEVASRVISAAEFRKLLVSHRRMTRLDRRHEKLRGLRDLDTGEVFLTDERRLIEAR